MPFVLVLCDCSDCRSQLHRVLGKRDVAFKIMQFYQGGAAVWEVMEYADLVVTDSVPIAWLGGSARRRTLAIRHGEFRWDKAFPAVDFVAHGCNDGTMWERILALLYPHCSA